MNIFQALVEAAKIEAFRILSAIKKGWFGTPLSFVLSIDRAYLALLTLMALDIIAGTLAAAVNRELSSHANRKGVIRKLMVLVLVGSIHVFSQAARLPVDLGIVAATAFCASELISIVENCIDAGVKMPRIVKDILYIIDKGWARKQNGQRGAESGADNRSS